MQSDRLSIELFLSRDGDEGQALARGLQPRALAEAPAGDLGDAGPAKGDARPESYLDDAGDLSSLRDQGWGVIAPKGEVGDRLLALVQPLIDQRAADQEAETKEVKVYSVPPGMTQTQATDWIDRKLVGNNPLRDIPRYLLVLGRPDEVSFELQQVLSGQAYCVGRVGFDTDAGYEAYVDKLLRSQRAPARGPSRAVYFTARDGTPATELGRRLLMQPCIANARKDRTDGWFAASEIEEIEDDDPARAADRLIEAAAGPGVLFSCSHGAGAPLDGWGSQDHRRALQGSLCLGRGRRLEAEALARASFIPGGVWLMFACFGAGTPSHSAYHHWLARLQQAGEHAGDLASVLASLPAKDEPPFIAALPQAALANPDGPLAVIGHLDLAWSYGFCDLDKMSRGERHRRFQDVVAQLVKGRPVGLAMSSLMRARSQIYVEIAIADDVAAADPAVADPRVRLGHRWMVLQDLAGYIVLGDPAAQIAAPAGPSPGAAEPAGPVAEIRTAPGEHSAATSGSAARRSDDPGEATASWAPGISAEDIQAAVHDLLAGRATLDELAARHGVLPAAVDEWRRVYTEAGLRAVASLAAGKGSSAR